MAACTQTDDQPITDTESEAVVENADDINPALTGTQIPNSPLRTIEVGYVLQVMSEIPASISLIDSAV